MLIRCRFSCYQSLESAVVSGMGLVVVKLLNAIARQPEVGGDVKNVLLFVTLAFIETLSIYGLLIAYVSLVKILINGN